MHTPLHFRRATPTDVPAIVALVQSAYRGESSRAGWTTEADFLDGQRTDAREVSALIEDSASGTRIVLGFADEALLSSMALECAGGTAWLGMIAVRPDHQSRGAGRAMLREAERIVRAERLSRELRMRVIAQRRELIAFYARRGYLPTGENEPFPYGEPRFGVPRRPDLSFVVLAKSLV